MSDRSRGRGASSPPSPAHPHRRHEPLPGHRPKPAAEDPHAPRRLRAILASSSYRQADEDVDFLSQDDTRGLRLQLDYLKPELLLNQHGIHHTVVVLGSTRIVEPAVASARVERLKAALADRPGDADLSRRLATAERVLAKSHYYEMARQFGQIASKEGHMIVMTGGGPGIMEAANRGAFDAGAKSVGLNITLPHRQYPNPYITPDLCFRFHYFALRKLHFMHRARALVVFPGGYGTLDELFEALALVQTRKMRPVPVVLVGEDYWRRVFDPEFLVEEGVIDREDRELFWFAESAEAIWQGIVRWYDAAGEPLRG